ncbi:MAG: 3 family protein [Gemmatimonadetes bacterium]|nr:3 family protein [Gemmatimonadota bacterium]
MEESTPRSGGLILGGLSGVVLQSFYTVYNALPYGLLESVYRNAMVVEIKSRGFYCETEYPVQASYKGVAIGEFHLDLLVAKQLVVELKVAKRIHPRHEAQLLNYLILSRRPVGLLLNFGPTPQKRRMVGPAARGMQ